MCGACGRDVVADPVLGPVRTTRDMLLVAQTVNAVIADLPGRPVVRVAGGRWTVAGRTGRTSACDTVRELWCEMVCHANQQGGFASGMDSLAASRVVERVVRSLPGESGLVDRVLREGMAAAREVSGGAARS